MSPEQVKLTRAAALPLPAAAPLLPIRIHNFSPRVQATSAARKNYTLCDMFAFGLIVKWLIVGDAADVPFAGLPADQIIRVHGSLESSGGTMVHPFIADLSRVPPVFRPIIQARFPPPFPSSSPLTYPTRCVCCKHEAAFAVA